MYTYVDIICVLPSFSGRCHQYCCCCNLCCNFFLLSVVTVQGTTCVLSRHSQKSELFRLQIEQSYNSIHLILVGSLQVTDILQMVNYPHLTTDTLPSQACHHSPLVQETYIFTKLTLNVPTNRPYTSSDQDFHWMVVGSVQMTGRLQMVNYLRSATDTLPSQASQSLSSPIFSLLGPMFLDHFFKSITIGYTQYNEPVPTSSKVVTT